MQFKEYEYYKYIYENTQDIRVVKNSCGNTLIYNSKVNCRHKDFSFALLLQFAIIANDIDFKEKSENKNSEKTFENEYHIYDELCMFFEKYKKEAQLDDFCNTFNIDTDDFENSTYALLQASFNDTKSSLSQYDLYIQ